ncbi:MAG TPA: hypothetical protein VJL32_00845 [Candidatus Paceibacterota bacterium]
MPNFLERIRTSDDQTKKRWLVGVSAVIMLVIVWVWLGYFNSLFMSPDASASPEQGGFSFWTSLKSGGSAAWDSMTASVKSFGKFFGGPKEYIIKPE